MKESVLFKTAVVSGGLITVFTRRTAKRKRERDKKPEAGDKNQVGLGRPLGVSFNHSHGMSSLEIQTSWEQSVK